MKKTNKEKKVDQKQADKIEEMKRAEENFQRIIKKISPFVKREKVKEYSTRGKWRSFSF